MRAATFFAVSAFAAGAFAQESSAVASEAPEVSSISIPPYSNPNTQYLTQTDSNGVITGQPTVNTILPTADNSIPDQPAVVTSQPLPASIPAGLGNGINTVVIANSTILVSVNTEATITSVVTPTPSSPSSGSDASPTGDESESGASGNGSPEASGTGAPGEGAGAAVRVASGALVGAGALFAAFL